MIRIKNSGQNTAVRQAVARVNALFLDVHFYEAICRQEQFDMCDISPARLAGLIRSTRMDMKVDFYYSVFPFSKAVTYDDPENPQTIWLNKWNLDRSAASIANTLMHQCIHAVNTRYPELYFGHGDNNSYQKEDTAPYWIASLAQRMIQNDNSETELMQHEAETGLPAGNRSISSNSIVNSYEHLQLAVPCF